ncbi:thrombospondin-type laminin G domain and EAR repeat-containing protein isoform X2 [Brachyhypopomus gauderio]|uniref:thrombospondin-type laminin G domain and EAR repeat-containing protein isoform X2 n=1 Tax=Brachyhypopomus gauderio TaxID=698409 RepID=UPI00404270CD
MESHVVVIWLVWLIPLFLLPLTRGATEAPWEPCTDLPLDLLSQVLSHGGAALEGVQDGDVQAVRFSSPSPALSFPASELFINCSTFPAEVSIMVTLKLPRMLQVSEYVFSVLREEGYLLLALRVSADRLQLLVGAPHAHQRLTFRGVRLADGHWHSLVLSVSGHHATLTIDCGIPLKLVQRRPFPSNLTTKSSWVHVGSRRRWKGLFSGLLRQLTLLPGSDAALHACHASKPSLAELAVPPALLDLPIKRVVHHPPYEAEVRVMLGSTHVCSKMEQGQLWLDTQKKGLFLCDGVHWLPMLQEKERLDYVDDHQDLHTSSETLDIELFRIPGAGLFAAMAHRAPTPGSALYHWNNGSFRLYQNLSMLTAHSWRHVTIGKQVFLAVSNAMHPPAGQQEQSVIYKWSVRKRKFVHYQTLNTHSARDWEAFHINNDTFLAVANHRTENGNHNIDSVIYKWNPGTSVFEVNQTLPTLGAYDWEFFTVGTYHFLAVANAFDGSSTYIDSSIYVWIGGAFQPFQTIRTCGATDWEMFQIGSRVFLAVANGHMLYSHGQSLYAINSTIYELDTSTKMFLKFQDILTYSGLGVLYPGRGSLPGSSQLL